ncbi:uncharacterized protein LOC122290955 [Carya illinoinensis]|uniref:uncharacterized protein LOC122290955 n=1 Tax=Carya illinoinensis TaxID=32201 RepID=UPI001C71E834|nr:uncharacterized protein LOC122290955 [Carya illinoinensis]
MGVIRGVKVTRGGTSINHLLFADDCILFGIATMEEWNSLQGILKVYEKASGQFLNKEKTSVFFSINTPGVVKSSILAAGNSVACGSYERYLGLPAVVGRSKDEESVTHVLWECQAANDVWALSLNGVHKWKRGGMEFLQLWEKLLEGLDKNRLEEVAVQIRRVWLRRNTFVFENKLTCPRRLVSAATEALEEFKRANRRQGAVNQQDHRPSSRAGWVKPSAEFVKVNWDASTDLKRRRMGMGVIMRDENADPLLAVCDSRSNILTAEVAECYALWKPLQVCSELNVQKVIFEGDAKAIIEAVKNNEEDWSDIDPLIEDIRNVLSNRKDWFIQFDYRERNIVAHNLAKAALNLVRKEFGWKRFQIV